MIDDAGAAPAAAEPVSPSQGSGGAAAQPDTGTRQEAPVIDRSKETARHSIDRAFAEIDKQQEQVKPVKDKPADAGKEQTEERADGRDDKGRFTKKDAAADGALPVDQQKPADKPGDTKAPAAALDVPSRFSADAKAAWASVPDGVKGEVNRAIRELEGGLTQYQQFFEPLKPFYELAQEAKTTVPEALARYTALDRSLSTGQPEERLAAIQEVLEYAGISPKEYAAFIMGQKPDEAQTQNDATIRQLRQELADLRSQFGGMQKSAEQRRADEIAAQVDKFAADNPRMNEPAIQQAVARLLGTGMAKDLPEAFQMAERLNPAPITKDPSPGSDPGKPKPPADQTRKGSLSIAGAPASGSNPANRKPPATARESLDRAFGTLGLG